MIISWLEKLSLIDYPGKTSCIVFTPGCNLRCSFCHNPEFVLPEKIAQLKHTFMIERDFFAFLEKRKWLLDGVSICGWEPTLQWGLTPFIKRVKSLWFLVKLDTNGSNPKILKTLIESELVDYIAMDVKQSWEKYPSLVGPLEDISPYLESVEIIKSSAKDYEFRTTVISPSHQKEDIESIARSLQWAKRYYLQKYRPGSVLDSWFFWESPSPSMLEEMKNITKKYINECHIRW